jgi:hypothetical protein
MKRNALIAIAIGLILIGVSVFAALNMLAPAPVSTGNTMASSPSAQPSPTTPVKVPTKTDVLENFALLKEKISAAGKNYGGAATQLIMGEETAMVYLYKPYGMNDVSDLLATGFTTVYSVFENKDPLMVGIVDTSQMINEQTFKVDIYALERSKVEEYLRGGLTGTELLQTAILVTPDTESLHPNGSSVKVSKDVYVEGNRTGSFSEPPSRTMFFTETLNESGYQRPISLQAAPLPDGETVVNVVMPLKRNGTSVDNYKEIEAALRACAGSYGDYDKYYISLIPPAEGFNDYYIIDARAAPVLDYFDGKINQYQLFNAINLTDYTK